MSPWTLKSSDFNNQELLKKLEVNQESLLLMTNPLSAYLSTFIV